MKSNSQWFWSWGFPPDLCLWPATFLANTLAEKKDGVSILLTLTWQLSAFLWYAHGKLVGSGWVLTFWGVFLHFNCHLGFGECRCVVVYVHNFYVKRQLLVQFLLGGFVKDVKLDLLTQSYIKPFPTIQTVGNILSGKHSNSKFAYMEGFLILFSVNRSMGVDFSCLGIYGEHVYWILIHSMTTYMELVVWLPKVVKHLAPAQELAFTDLFLNFMCTTWVITCEMILGYGPGSSSCISMVDKTHRLLLRTKGPCWDRGECQPHVCPQSHTFLPDCLTRVWSYLLWVISKASMRLWNAAESNLQQQKKKNMLTTHVVFSSRAENKIVCRDVENKSPVESSAPSFFCPLPPSPC